MDCFDDCVVVGVYVGFYFYCFDGQQQIVFFDFFIGLNCDGCYNVWYWCVNVVVVVFFCFGLLNFGCCSGVVCDMDCVWLIVEFKEYFDFVVFVYFVNSLQMDFKCFVWINFGVDFFVCFYIVEEGFGWQCVDRVVFVMVIYVIKENFGVYQIVVQIFVVD